MLIPLREECNTTISFWLQRTFHSGWNGMAITFWPEWNATIPFLPEWKPSFQKEWNGHSIPAGMECHFFNNLKNYAASTKHTIMQLSYLLLLNFKLYKLDCISPLSVSFMYIFRHFLLVHYVPYITTSKLVVWGRPYKCTNSISHFLIRIYEILYMNFQATDL